MDALRTRLSAHVFLTWEDDGVDKVGRSYVLVVAILWRGNGLHHHHAAGSEQRIRSRKERSKIVMAHRFDLQCTYVELR